MPLIPAGIEWMIRKQNWKYLWITSAGLGLSFLSGMAQFWLFNLILLLTYGLYRIWIQDERQMGLKQLNWILVSLLLAIGLGIVQTTQTLSALKDTSRGGTAAQASLYSGRNHLSPRKLPTLAIPNLYSTVEENVFSKLLLSPPAPEAKGLWGRLMWGEKGFVLNRSWGYIGILGFFFMVLGFGAREKTIRFHKWMVAGVLAFQVLLCWKPFHDFCLKLWAGFDTLDHTRTIILYVFSGSVLAAFGLDRILESRRWAQILQRTLAIAIALFVILVIALHAAPAALKINQHISNLASLNADSRFAPAFFTDAAHKISEGFHRSAEILYPPILFLIALCISLWMLKRNSWTLKQFQLVILLIAMTDLLYHGWTDPPLVYTDRQALYPQNSKVVEFLKRDPDQFRVYELQLKKQLPEPPLDNYNQLDFLRKGSIRFFDYRSVDFVMRPNTLLAYGVKSAGGYLSLYPGRYKALWNGRGMDVLKAFKPESVLQDWNAPWIGMQNIKYIAVADSIDTGAWRPAYQAEGVQLLKVDSFCPVIYVVRSASYIEDYAKRLQMLKSSSFRPLEMVLLDEPPPQGMASDSNVPYSLLFKKRTPDLLELNVALQQDGYLIFAENFMPGWRAWVNGVEQRLWRANLVFMCLPLKKGSYQITLEFRPALYGWSLFLSMVSAIIIVLPGISLWNKRRRHQSTPR
jgi:preprotein translocase subunit SecG